MKFTCNPTNTALVITDPQNDFLSEEGKGYKLTKKSVEKNDTLKNLEKLMATAVEKGYRIFISPHYLYPHDLNWEHTGKEQELLIQSEVYRKQDIHSPTPEVSDFVPSLIPYIQHETTIIATPHKVASPETNDLVYQLRQHKIDQVLIAGVLSNVCVESHMRHLIEHAFTTAIVYDATAATSTADFDAAMTNYKAFATDTFTTKEIIKELISE